VPGEPFQTLLRRLESKGLLHLIGGPGACIREDRLWTMTVRDRESAQQSSHLTVFKVFGAVVEPEHAVLLDMEVTAKRTDLGRSADERISDQASVPDPTRTVEWTGSPVMIPDGRHAVLLLDSPKPGAGRPNEICCLIVRPTIVEPVPAKPAGSPG
jgi:hypothetical protein